MLMEKLKWFWDVWLTREKFLKIFILLLLIIPLWQSVEFKQSLLSFNEAMCYNALYGQGDDFTYTNGIQTGHKNYSNVPTFKTNLTVCPPCNLTTKDE